MQQKIEHFINQYVNYVKGLTKREKLVLLVVGASLGAFILVGGILSPMMSYRAKLADSVSSKDDQLRKIYELSPRIKIIKDSGANHGAPENFTLFRYLEELSAKIKVNDRIEYMKPINEAGSTAREAVEFKIRSVYQEDLISLLYDIEHCPYSLVVKRLNIRRMEKDKNIDVVFQVIRNG